MTDGKRVGKISSWRKCLGERNVGGGGKWCEYMSSYMSFMGEGLCAVGWQGRWVRVSDKWAGRRYRYR